MIISHEHRFIFIKTKKTAGTSIEIVLSDICGEHDIITPITPPDELIREKMGVRGPQNYVITPERFYYNHISALEIRSLAGEDIWNSYFKFCFERNPWDKVVSWYFWEFPTEPRPSISEFIRSGHAGEVGGPGGIDLYTINGKIAVNAIGRYEHLEEHLNRIAAHLRLPELPALPHAKASFRTDRRHYRELLSDEDRAIITKTFAREISLFGYTF